MSDHKEGMGVERKPNGEEYSGMFVDGVREGQGEVRTKAGYYYKGEWKDGSKNGNGEEID